ncbi:MAG: hypothetical protein QOF76_2468 [Solirubrobacteraceae bacterium]|nr:hypothetical protein [Solirubrobacteraceae bacterium]
MTLPSTGWRLPALVAPLVAALALFVGTAAAAAPTVVTSPIDDPTLYVTDTYALLSGVINPNGQPTVYKFQYGKTSGYGHETPVTAAGNGKAEVPVDVAVEDLKPNTTYHFRLVAFPDPAQSSTYGVAQTAGEDQTFTTYPALSVAFASKRAKVTMGKAAVQVKADGPPDTVARGRVGLKAKLDGKLRKIGSAAFRVTTGKTKTVRVSLGARARKALAKRGSLKAKARAKTKGLKAVTTKLTLAA